MIDYSKSKIYIIKTLHSDMRTIKFYVGSTTMDLLDKFKSHKYNKNSLLFKCVEEYYNGDWSKFSIELLQNVECKSKKELKKLRLEKITEIRNTYRKVIQINHLFPTKKI